MLPVTTANAERAQQLAAQQQEYRNTMEKLSAQLNEGKIDVRKYREEINTYSCEWVQKITKDVPKMPGTIAVFGRTSAGKSSLLNALFSMDPPLLVADGDTTKDVRVVGVCGDFQVVDVYGSNDDRMYEEEFSLTGIAHIDLALVCSDTDPSGVRFVTNLVKAGKVRKCFYIHTKSGDGTKISQETKQDEVDFSRKYDLVGPIYTELKRPETIQNLRQVIAKATQMRFAQKTVRVDKVIISEEHIRKSRKRNW